MRRVPEHLKIKVIKWFDYLWMTQKSSDEEKSVGFLPGTIYLVMPTPDAQNPHAPLPATVSEH